MIWGHLGVAGFAGLSPKSGEKEAIQAGIVPKEGVCEGVFVFLTT